MCNTCGDFIIIQMNGQKAKNFYPVGPSNAVKGRVVYESLDGDAAWV